MFPRLGGNIALKDLTGASMTYTELSNRSNAIAMKLLDYGITQGAVVAVF